MPWFCLLPWIDAATHANSSAAKPPLLLCVKPGLTGDGPGSFEANLASLQLTEGEQYLHLS